MWKFLLLIALCHSASARIIQKTDENFDAPIINDEPVIGVLSQEISYYLDGKYPDQYKSYIAASYVKFVEGGGARVVPIW